MDVVYSLVERSIIAIIALIVLVLVKVLKNGHAVVVVRLVLDHRVISFYPLIVIVLFCASQGIDCFIILKRSGEVLTLISRNYTLEIRLLLNFVAHTVEGVCFITLSPAICS